MSFHMPSYLFVATLMSSVDNILLLSDKTFQNRPKSLCLHIIQ